MAAGVVVLIPTAATIYADWVQALTPAWRHAAFLCWLAAAALIVVDQLRRDERSDRSLAAFESLTDEKRQQLRQLALQSQESVFRSFLTPDLWFPRKWEWTVYVHDPTIDRLTSEQQRHFAKRGSVVATPIWDHEEKVGVLAGICDGEDRFFEQQVNQSHIRQTATVLGTLLGTLRPKSELDHGATVKGSP